MPLIRVDYNETSVTPTSMNELVTTLLEESMRIYDYGEDKVSVFTAPYGEHSFSTADAEIEIRAKLAEYQKPGTEPNELRLRHLDDYKQFLTKFIQEHELQKGLLVTITFEDWQVEWLPANVA